MTESFFRRHPVVESALLFALLLLTSTITTFYPLWPNIIINIAIPAIATLAVYQYKDRFGIVKIWTLILLRILLVLTVLNYIQGDTFNKIYVVFFCLNILEAVISDALDRKLLNALSGFFVLIGATFFVRVVWAENTYPFVTSCFFLFFIFSYAIWNINFVFLKYGPAIGKYHVIVQFVPLLFILLSLEPGFWLIIRGNSLLTGALIQLCFLKHLKLEFVSKLTDRYFSDFQKPLVQSGIALATIGLVAIFLIKNIHLMKCCWQ